MAFMDDFRVLAVMYAGLVVLVLMMRRIRIAPAERPLPAAEALAASAE